MTYRNPDDWYDSPPPDNVVVGDRTWLYSAFAFLHCRSRRPVALRIGADSGVYIGTVFELGPDAEVTIGDYCTVAGAVVATNGRISIGNHVLISFQTALADVPVCAPPTSSSFERPAVSPPIVIEDNVWIGARAIVLGGASIGEGSIIGAAAVVDFPVPPYSVVAGNPGRIVGDVDRSLPA